MGINKVTNSCVRLRVAITRGRRARNFRARNGHSFYHGHGSMRCGLFYFSVLQSRVGLFIRECTSHLCTAKCFVQGSRFILDMPVTS